MAARPDPAPDDWKRRWPPVRYWVEAAVGVALALFVLAAAEKVRNILVMVVIAMVIAVGLDPAVRRLQRLRMGRGTAVAVVFPRVLLFVPAVVAPIGPPRVPPVRGPGRAHTGHLHQLGPRA